MNDDKYIFLSEEFYLAFIGFFFVFPPSALRKVGARLTALQTDHGRGGAPVINADAFLQVEGSEPLDYPYNVYDFGELGPIDRAVAGMKLVVVHLNHTLYQGQVFVRTPDEMRAQSTAMARRGPYRNIERREYRRYFRNNAHIGEALRRRIPVRFNSLMSARADFRKAALKRVRKIITDPLGLPVEDLAVDIFHCKVGQFPHKFWQSNFVHDARYREFSIPGSPFFIYTSRESRKLGAVLRVPPHPAVGDPHFASLAVPLAYSLVQDQVFRYYDALADEDTGEAIRRYSSGKILGKLTHLHNLSAKLKEWESIPLFQDDIPQGVLAGFADAGGVAYLDSVRQATKERLSLGFSLHDRLLAFFTRVEHHLQTAATKRLNTIILFAGGIAAAFSILDVVVAVVGATTVKKMLLELWHTCLTDS